MSTDKSAAAVRELAEKIVPVILNAGLLCNTDEIVEAFTGDLTALISEHYYPKEKYDELLQQRDELKEALNKIFAICEDGQELNMANYNHDDVYHLNETFVEIYLAAEAAIKNTETK